MDKELFEFEKNAILGKVGDHPLCREYKSLLRQCGDDKERLVLLALQQQSIPFFCTACYRGLGLTKEYLKSAFGEYVNGAVFHDCDGVEGYSYGLYVDWNSDRELNAITDVLSLMWCKDTCLVVPKVKCPAIYVSNSSHCNIVLEGYNSPKVYIFDDSSVNIETADEYSTVVIYKYSEESVVSEGKFCLGNVRVFSKNLRL